MGSRDGPSWGQEVPQEVELVRHLQGSECHCRAGLVMNTGREGQAGGLDTGGREGSPIPGHRQQGAE